ncbi:T7SS effector LXG polymorphic toxin [Listeria booriae]|uniref:Transposase n=1 Tax=Listeria booriae TaxID=1552123 RepID=A0A7X0ZTL3_9LIST|nr:T7SS effector LXG polymorphic toxin [Listeria booriae]MBC2285527.1 transposase [Listeria booriae]MBC2292551.1 transposase [Listeria booriae]MBC2310275.1 transposase [Listeria booriae]
MSLNMYLGEVDAQTISITDICNETIQAMNQVIQSIDTFTGDVILKGDTYDSAKIYFSQTYRVIAQGIIVFCERLIEQNKAFPTNFRSEVANTDVIEDELKDQIHETEKLIMDLEQVSNGLLNKPQINLFDSVKRNLERKLEDLYQYNTQSSTYFNDAEQLAKDIEKGLTDVNGGRGFNQTSGVFALTGITMGWQTALRNADKGIDPVKVEELKDYDVYAIVYADAKGNPQIIWHLEKDGKGVTNTELYRYLIQSGKYLDGEDYTIWGMDDYTKHLQDGWRNGINYQNGDEYNSFISGTLAASQYVEDGYVWVQESGMYDMITMLGLSYSAYKMANLNESINTKVPKLSSLSAEEQLNLANQYKQNAPIDIPENVKIKAQSKSAGYEQITYKWTDSGYKYEARWHTKTPGAPEGQGNTWVIQRTIPGNGGAKPQTSFKTGNNEWIEAYKWYDAISARQNGNATAEQIRILDNGHWKE